MEKEPTNNEERRAIAYKAEADIFMMAALGYEREKNQTKADAKWALYDAKKAEIRTKFPD